MIHNQPINSKDINIKKFLKYSDNYTLIPIKYNNNDLLIQTPKMYIPFGEKTLYDKKYLDLSFQNIMNDKNIELFYHNLMIIHGKVLKLFHEYNVDDIIKRYNNTDLLRLKITKDILNYDHNRNIIDKIINNTYGYFIIHLKGLWLNNGGNIYYYWELLQSKIDVPLYLSEYSFIDDYPTKGKGYKGKGKSIPPPPPPPQLIQPKPLTKYDKMIKMGVPTNAVENKKKIDSKIRAEDLQSITLKKTVINKNEKDDEDIPYMIELLSKLSKLRQLNL
tara:strand:+ start:135 stop:962 length:828 start_codon:yes stop_codon:yes gene_type:complete